MFKNYLTEIKQTLAQTPTIKIYDNLIISIFDEVMQLLTQYWLNEI